MSNDVIKFKVDQSQPDPFAWADPNEESLADGIGASYGIVGYKGGRWTLKHRGVKHILTRPDGTPNPWLDCIIIGQAPNKSRSFYPKWEEGNDDAPTCSSLDGITPDVPQPQAASCNICPKNVLFLNPETGRRTTECKEHKRLALLLLPAVTTRIFGEPMLDLVFLRVPAASLQNLSLLGDHARAIGRAFYTFVTRVSFDPTTSYPKMIFEGIQLLDAAQEPLIRRLRSEPQLARIITGGGGATNRALPAPAAAGTISRLTAGDNVVETGFAAVEQRVNPSAQALMGKKAEPQTIEANPVPTPVDMGGFGAPTEAAQEPAQTVIHAAPQAAVANQGPPQAADAAMQAKLDALMPRE